MSPGALGQPQHLCANPDAPLVQRSDGDLVALSRLAQQVLLRNLAAIQDQFTGAAGANAQLVFLAAHGKSRRVLFYQKGRDAAIACRRIEGGKDDKQPGLACVRDPKLAPVEAEAACNRLGAGLEGKGVGA